MYFKKNIYGQYYSESFDETRTGCTIGGGTAGGRARGSDSLQLRSPVSFDCLRPNIFLSGSELHPQPPPRRKSSCVDACRQPLAIASRSMQTLKHALHKPCMTQTSESVTSRNSNFYRANDVTTAERCFPMRQLQVARTTKIAHRLAADGLRLRSTKDFAWSCEDGIPAVI